MNLRKIPALLLVGRNGLSVLLKPLWTSEYCSLLTLSSSLSYFSSLSFFSRVFVLESPCQFSGKDEGIVENHPKVSLQALWFSAFSFLPSALRRAGELWDPFASAYKFYLTPHSLLHIKKELTSSPPQVFSLSTGMCLSENNCWAFGRGNKKMEESTWAIGSLPEPENFFLDFCGHYLTSPCHLKM